MIKDSVILITGGASGLGQATAVELYDAGAIVIICDLKQSENNSKTDPERYLEFQADVTSETDIKKLMETIKTRFGKLNGIVNCAGIYSFETIYNFDTNEPHSLELFQKIINVNLGGTFNVIRLGIPLMIANIPNEDGERGVIINTSSITARGRGVGGDSIAYIASKGAVNSMTIPLAKDLSQYGIRVVDIVPGPFLTTLWQSGGTTANNTKYDNFFEKMFPKRCGKPNEYAEVVKSIFNIQFINGTSIEIDGLSHR